MKKLMVCALLSGMVMTCQATGVHWQYLDGSADGSFKAYVDTNSLNRKKHTGMIREVSSFANGKRLSTDYRIYEANCQTDQYRVISRNGKAMDGYWNTVNPNSVGASIYRWLCGQ